MSILVDSSTRVLVQGGTGRNGRRQIGFLDAAGHPAVASVTPGRGGESVLEVPIFDSVQEAVEATGVTASVVHVPPQGGAAATAVVEAVEAGITVITVVAEGIPVHESLRMIEVAREHGATVVGPNCLGVMTAQACSLGMLPMSLAPAGSIGVISRSGTLSLEVTKALGQAGLGVSTTVSMGGDPVTGQTQAEYLAMFEQDPQTSIVTLVGEPGGTMELDAADFIAQTGMPVLAYLAGSTAPEGKRMGHLGALTTGRSTSVAYKKEALRDAGAIVVDNPWDLPAVAAQMLTSVPAQG